MDAEQPYEPDPAVFNTPDPVPVRGVDPGPDACPDGHGETGADE